MKCPEGTGDKEGLKDMKLFGQQSFIYGPRPGESLAAPAAQT